MIYRRFSPSANHRRVLADGVHSGLWDVVYQRLRAPSANHRRVLADGVHSGLWAVIYRRLRAPSASTRRRRPPKNVESLISSRFQTRPKRAVWNRLFFISIRPIFTFSPEVFENSAPVLYTRKYIYIYLYYIILFIKKSECNEPFP